MLFILSLLVFALLCGGLVAILLANRFERSVSNEIGVHFWPGLVIFGAAMVVSSFMCIIFFRVRVKNIPYPWIYPILSFEGLKQNRR